MKFKSFALAILAAAALPLFADTYNIDKQHSEASFQVRHFVTQVRGKFDDFSGAVNIVPGKPAESSVEFHIKAASINTGVADRDNHLRSVDFFDVANFPEITFKSTSIKPGAAKDTYDVTGDLTMHGITKRVTLAVTHLGTVNDPWGNLRAGFSLETTLNRQEYGIKWNKVLDNGGTMLSDDVKVFISLEATKKK